MLKTKSIKQDLIITLSLITTTALIVVLVIGFLHSQRNYRETFDANLIKSANLVFSLIRHEVHDENDMDFAGDIKPTLQQEIFHQYEYKIHIQAWAGEQQIYNSDDFLNNIKPDYEGFKNMMIDGEAWRGFSFYNQESDLRVLVAEKDYIKISSISNLISCLALPILISCSLLLFVIVVTVNRKLRPFEKIAGKVEKMSAQTLQQLSDPTLPIELQPFVNSFNSLITRLIESIETERNFTNYAAHELKTPLAAISVQAHTLINNRNKDKEKEYSQNLLNGIERASHLINQLLTLSRLDADNANIEKKRFSLKETMQSIIKNYLPEAQKKDLNIEFLCLAPEEKTVIETNKIYIEILLGNLLDNAIKYSLRGNSISVLLSRKSSQKKNCLSLKISNFGEEILPAEIEKIFNNFYRVSRVNSSNIIGCGLGLAIAKKISDLNSAKIFFESKNGINSVEVIFAELS